MNVSPQNPSRDQHKNKVYSLLSAVEKASSVQMNGPARGMLYAGSRALEHGQLLIIAESLQNLCCDGVHPC